MNNEQHPNFDIQFRHTKKTFQLFYKLLPDALYTPEAITNIYNDFFGLTLSVNEFEKLDEIIKNFTKVSFANLKFYKKVE